MTSRVETSSLRSSHKKQTLRCVIDTPLVEGVCFFRLALTHEVRARREAGQASGEILVDSLRRRDEVVEEILCFSIACVNVRVRLVH